MSLVATSESLGSAGNAGSAGSKVTERYLARAGDRGLANKCTSVLRVVCGSVGVDQSQKVRGMPAITFIRQSPETTTSIGYGGTRATLGR